MLSGINSRQLHAEDGEEYKGQRRKSNSITNGKGGARNSGERRRRDPDGKRGQATQPGQEPGNYHLGGRGEDAAKQCGADDQEPCGGILGARCKHCVPLLCQAGSR